MSIDTPASAQGPPAGDPSAPASGHLQTQSFSGSRPRSHSDSTDVSTAAFSSNSTLHGTFRYQIVREIARGGMGRVLLAHDAHIDRDVAIKELLPGGKSDGQSDLANRFLAEGQVTGQLQHPGIVPVYELGQKPDGNPFYVMKLLGERTLLQALRDYHALPAKSAARELAFNELMTQFVGICNAVAFAHNRGVIHRDLKPRNIMLGEFGEVHVVDWGLAKVLDEQGQAAPAGADPSSEKQPPPPAGGGSSGSHASGSKVKVRSTLRDEDTQTQVGRVVGTPAYMSPEQAWGATLDIRADIFSLGAILYEILTAQPPYYGGSSHDMLAAAREGNCVPPRSVNGDVPPELDAICRRATSRESAERYPSARHLADDVRCWQAGEPVSAFDEPWWRSAARWMRKYPTGFVAAGSVALALVVAFLAWGRWEQVRRDQMRESVAQLVEKSHERRLAGDWPAAEANLTRAATLLDYEPNLPDLTVEVRGLLDDTRQHIALQQRGEQRRKAWVEIQRLRDDALFHGTLFNGLADEENRRLSEQAATGALELLDREFGPGDSSSRGADSLLPAAALPPLRLELLVTLADTRTALVRGKGLAVQRQAAQAALKLLDGAQASLPASRAFHLCRARLLHELSDDTAAEAAQKQAAAAVPSLASDFFLLGDDELQAGRHAQALPHFERTLQLDPEHFWARYFAAVSRLRQAQPALALGHLSACLVQRPEFAWAHLLRGYAYGQLDDFPAAEADFAAAQSKGIEPYAYHINRGAILLGRGDEEAALAEFEAALQARPDAYQGYVNRAEIHRRRKEFDDALQDLTRAAELAPQVAAIPWLRAQVLAEHDDPEAALAQLGRLAMSPPGEPKLRAQQLALQAQLLARLERRENALAAIDQALALAPQRAWHRLRASLLFALHRDAEARASLDAFLAADQPEGAADAHRQRAFERARAGDHLGAVVDYSMAIEMDPLVPQAHASRGWALLNQAAPLALRDFEAALRAEDQNADFLNGRAYAQVLLGDHRRAVADAESAIALGAKSGEPREKVAILYNAACVYAQAFARVTFSAETPARERLLGEYESRALALLREAAALLPAAAKKPIAGQWKTDAALEPLRARAGLAEIIQDLARG